MTFLTRILWEVKVEWQTNAYHKWWEGVVSRGLNRKYDELQFTGDKYQGNTFYLTTHYPDPSGLLNQVAKLVLGADGRYENWDMEIKSAIQLGTVFVAQEV